MKITVLTENTSAAGLPTEHGLSLYIETDGINILFDTGQSGLFAENAERLGVDLKQVDIAVISHGHYDHGGGIAKFIEINDKAPVYLSSLAFGDHFNAEGKYIGLDKRLMNSERIILCDGITELREDILLFPASEVPRITDTGSFGLSMMKDGAVVPDDFSHEQYLLITERISGGSKRVLFSGCAHRGIIDITARFKPDYLFGGFHFMKMSPGEKLLRCAERLNTYTTSYYTCHCTGLEQYDFIKPHMNNIHYISTGEIITV